MMERRHFLKAGLGGAILNAGVSLRAFGSNAATFAGNSLPADHAGEDLIAWVTRSAGQWDQQLYRRILGAANEFKEGDQIVGVAAADEQSRIQARRLLSRTTIEQIDTHPPFRDQLSDLLAQHSDGESYRRIGQMTIGQLKTFLLEEDESAIRKIRDVLSSDVIACVVRLMTNDELISVGAKVFNPLPGSQIGAKGYLGARIQPNSPTDNVNDIRWQVFNGFSFAVGDVLLGTNPVSSDPDSVAAVEKVLQDILVTFGIDDVMPHCVLAHIDVQAEVERQQNGLTELWFQSIAGNDAANQTFDISVEKMLTYADERSTRFGLYFETGQGADFTNGHGHGTDMVVHESRKYGFARLLSQHVAASLRKAGKPAEPWVHLNDVAGFIGPEVFRSREQLVRCCLEDIVMGKLHGLTIGLDVCSTLHMDVSLSDLDWCLDQIMPANPAYLMALPTKIDPMLGYLTTSFHDHVRLREKFGFRVNDQMWAFFRRLGVITPDGRPSEHFGDPVWVYLQYCRAKGDVRTDDVIRLEGQLQAEEVRQRGVFLAEGYGSRFSDPAPQLAEQVQFIYEDSRKCIWLEVSDDFANRVPHVRRLRTRSADRTDYILHPVSGEHLSDESLADVQRLRDEHRGQFDVQIVISDGLNALAVTTPNHLDKLTEKLRSELGRFNLRAAPEHLLVHSGRVRAGYRIGETLFGGLEHQRSIIHIIGERPGSGHHTLSIYLTAASGETWKIADKVDHNITRVVSGIASTALLPETAAVDAVRILRDLMNKA